MQGMSTSIYLGQYRDAQFSLIAFHNENKRKKTE